MLFGWNGFWRVSSHHRALISTLVTASALNAELWKSAIRLYFLGLYENNPVGLWSPFFRKDCSHLLALGMSWVTPDYSSLFWLAFRECYFDSSHRSFGRFLRRLQHQSASRRKADHPQLLWRIYQRLSTSHGSDSIQGYPGQGPSGCLDLHTLHHALLFHPRFLNILSMGSYPRIYLYVSLCH